MISTLSNRDESDRAAVKKEVLSNSLSYFAEIKLFFETFSQYIVNLSNYFCLYKQMCVCVSEYQPIFLTAVFDRFQPLYALRKIKINPLSQVQKLLCH